MQQIRSNTKLRLLWVLLVGIAIGHFTTTTLFSSSRNDIYNHFYRKRNLMNQDIDILNYSENLTAELNKAHVHKNENSSVADNLYKEVRILCWIMTNPANHKTRALTVKSTWGKRCNKLLIMSSAEDKELETIALPVKEGREYLWAKTRLAFKYIYEHHFNDADWFFKADDDTYTVVENLRYMLYPYSPETAIYFGRKFKPFVDQGYMSGGAGYVLSKEALRRFIEVALPNTTICNFHETGAEDVQIGKCLDSVNVTAGDSRDIDNRSRFFPFHISDHINSIAIGYDWYKRYKYYDTKEGLNCCSDHAISFHYMPPKDMYLYDYFIYHLRPFGIHSSPDTLPPRLEVGETTIPTPAPTNKSTTSTTMKSS